MNNFLKFIEVIASGDMSFRETSLNDKIGLFVVDTVKSPDCGWETGIMKGTNPWVIVEEYQNKKEAKKGHVEWVEKIKKNKKIKLKSCRSTEDWFFGK